MNKTNIQNLHNICQECGKRIFNKTIGIATWHYQNCDACLEFKAVTEVRDFTEKIKLEVKDE